MHDALRLARYISDSPPPHALAEKVTIGDTDRHTGVRSLAIASASLPTARF